jgi:ABC-type branched-subunit amino acid transport system ATPase component
VLTVDGITSGYGKLPILHHVHLSADAKDLIAVLGPNGSGKSTLLKTVVGLVRTSAGQATIGDVVLTGLPPHRIVQSGVSYVPQSGNVFPSLTVRENLEIGAFTYRGDVRKRADSVVSIFPDLVAAMRKRAGDLSGGQQNMLGIARALMLEPKVLLVDEPSSGLAPRLAVVVMERLRTIADSGVAVVVVEQNVDLAVEFADWIYILVAGKNRIDGSALTIKANDLKGIFLGQTSHGVTQSEEDGAISTEKTGGRR